MKHFFTKSSFSKFSMFLINLSFIYFSSINHHICQFCQNERKQQLDWFVGYKIPNENSSTEKHLGLNYVYMTNDDHFQGWKLSRYLINSSFSLVGSTLNPFYRSMSFSSKSNQDLNFILYSDKPPDHKEVENYGHSKGVIGFNSKTGFWIVHSVPNFPPNISNQKYDYPKSGIMNGQSFLCISFNTSLSLFNIIGQFLYIKPFIYDFKIDAEMRKDYPILNRLIEKNWHLNGSNLITINSLAGIVFEIISKSSAENIDLYADLIAKKVESGLLVETWRKGNGGSLPSDCTHKFVVKNIKAVGINLLNDHKATWEYTEDHSKWAIGTDQKKPLTCIGDINRMKSQYKRGGGAVCFYNSYVWRNFFSSIKKIEQCSRFSQLFETYFKKTIIFIKQSFNSIGLKKV